MLLTSLFGVEVLGAVDPACPWVVVNSTFYVGPPCLDYMTRPEPRLGSKSGEAPALHGITYALSHGGPNPVGYLSWT